MPLNITLGSASARGFGFGTVGLITLTTGSEQTASVTGSTEINLADGNIMTGSLINSNSAQSIRYKTLTVNNTVATYGSRQTASYSNCSGGSYNDTDLSSGYIASGRYLADDGESRYSGYGAFYYKSFGLVFYHSISWSSSSLTSTVQTNQWTDVPSTTVTNSATVNICTGQRYYVGSGACGRLTYASINHQLYYRTLTVS